MPPQLWIDTVLELRRNDADVYFLSCANIHATDAIETIEAAVGKPVVTSNQAAFWHALRTIGLKDAPAGLEAARRAGMRAIGTGPGATEGADLRIPSLDRLPPGAFDAMVSAA